MKELVERAHAKINLSLDVTARRENGYHEVDGVMQSVSLCDEVRITLDEAEALTVDLIVEGNPEVPANGKNLAVRAALLLMEHLKRTGSLRIALTKRIPMAGGLAGGSADAAAVLRGVNRLLGSPLSVEELCALGARLGADVPFCVKGGAMRTRGIGELLTPVSPMPDCCLVVAKLGEGVSTPEAYAALDARFGNFSGKTARPDARLDSLLDAIEREDLSSCCVSFYNIFESVTEPIRPMVTVLKDTMRSKGALAAMMSGSGPSVFGVFSSRSDAEKACEELISLGAEAHVCSPVRDNF